MGHRLRDGRTTDSADNSTEQIAGSGADRRTEGRLVSSSALSLITHSRLSAAHNKPVNLKQELKMKLVRMHSKGANVWSGLVYLAYTPLTFFLDGHMLVFAVSGYLRVYLTANNVYSC